MSYNLQIANGENSVFTDIISQVFTNATYEMDNLRPTFSDYSGFLGNGGRTVQVPVMPAVSVAEHTDGNTVSATNNAMSSVDITTNVFAGRVDITDHFEAASEVAIANWAGQSLARAYMEQVETTLASAIDNLDSDSAIAAAADQTVVAASGDVKALVSTAKKNMRAAKVMGDMFIVLSNTAADRLRAQLTAVSAGDLSDLGNAVLATGASSMTLFGMNVVESAVLKTVDSAEIGGVYAREAMGYAEKRNPSLEIGRVTGELANRIVLSGQFGAGAVDNRYGYKVSYT